MNESDYLGWYLDRGGSVSGPYTARQIRTMWKAGQIGLSDRMCREQSEEWVEMRAHLSTLDGGGSVEGLLRHGIYAVLALGGGWVGAHNVFADQFGSALVKWAGLAAAGLLLANRSGWGWVVLAALWLLALLEAAGGPGEKVNRDAVKGSETNGVSTEPSRPFISGKRLSWEEWVAVLLGAIAVGTALVMMGR